MSSIKDTQKWLKKLNIDYSVQELKELRVLNISNKGLSNVSLLVHLPELRSLICGLNNIENIPLLPKLVYLKCGFCQIKELPCFPNLEELYCWNNLIKELPCFPNLKELNCGYNLIKELPYFPRIELINCDPLIVLESELDKIQFYIKHNLKFQMKPDNKLSRKLYK